MEIKLGLFFDIATTNGWWGNLEVFGQRNVDCAEATKKTVQAMKYEWWGFFVAGDLPCGAACNYLPGEA